MPIQREKIRNERKKIYIYILEVGGWRNLQNLPETWDVRDSQDSKGGTLDEMPYIGERDLVEPISSRKTGHQMRDGVAIPQSKVLPKIVPV